MGHRLGWKNGIVSQSPLQRMEIGSVGRAAHLWCRTARRQSPARRQPSFKSGIALADGHP
jgi:hypothetical protein